MALSRQEQEVIITWDAEEKVARIYAADPVYIRKLDKLCEEFPETYKCITVAPDGLSKDYTVPAELISFHKPRGPMNLNEEQREAKRQAMKRLREKLRET